VVEATRVRRAVHHTHASKARVATRYPEPVNGEFVLDDTPGLGVEIDEAAVERFSVDRAGSEDGSAATSYL